MVLFYFHQSNILCTYCCSTPYYILICRYDFTISTIQNPYATVKPELEQTFNKIFVGNEDLQLFLKKNKDKKCKQKTPVFTVGEYKEYPHTEVRKLSSDEIQKYMSAR